LSESAVTRAKQSTVSSSAAHGSAAAGAEADSSALGSSEAVTLSDGLGSPPDGDPPLGAAHAATSATRSEQARTGRFRFTALRILYRLDLLAMAG
jgi:hypothetical protein